MAEPTCKHGVRLDRSCIKCGRYLPMVDESYLAKQSEFLKGVQELEAALKPFMEEVAKAQAQSDEIDRIESNEEPPPDRPWYRKH